MSVHAKSLHFNERDNEGCQASPPLQNMRRARREIASMWPQAYLTKGNVAPATGARVDTR